MIGKIIAGSSFAGTVGYVMKELSRILDAEGVNPPEVKNIIEDFKDQTRLNPRLKNTVGHISFSFSPKEAPHMTDALMTQIAKEYMQKMGITDTQYLLVRHLDQPHPHCHLVYNRVGNKGQTISDKNIKIRNTKVCRELTEKYGLHLAPGKDSVRRERLREPDKTKYEIYDAIKGCLPKCKSWNVNISWKFRKFIKKQHTSVCHTDLPGHRYSAAPCQRCSGDCMMNITKRTLCDQRVFLIHQPQYTVDLRNFQTFFP